MAHRLRLVARFARVVLAVAVLAVVSAPATAAYADSFASVAAVAASRGERAIVRAPAKRARVAREPPAPRRGRTVVARPAGARDVIVRRRVYVRHAAILC